MVAMETAEKAKKQAYPRGRFFSSNFQLREKMFSLNHTRLSSQESYRGFFQISKQDARKRYFSVFVRKITDFSTSNGIFEETKRNFKNPLCNFLEKRVLNIVAKFLRSWTQTLEKKRPRVNVSNWIFNIGENGILLREIFFNLFRELNLIKHNK